MRSFMLFTLPMLFMSATADGGAGGGGGGGGGAAPPAGAPNGAAPPAGGQQQQQPAPPPSGDGDEKIPITRKELDAKLADRADRASKRARQELVEKFKDAGITSEEDLEKLVKAHKDNLEAQKSELQKEREKALKAEKDREAAQAEATSAKEEARRLRVFTGAGVTDHDVVGVLLDKAKAGDKDLNEGEWLAKLKKDRPYLFGSEAPPPKANSGRKPEGGESPPGNGAQPDDVSKLTPEQLRARAVAAGINPRLIGA